MWSSLAKRTWKINVHMMDFLFRVCIPELWLKGLKQQKRSPWRCWSRWKYPKRWTERLLLMLPGHHCAQRSIENWRISWQRYLHTWKNAFYSRPVFNLVFGYWFSEQLNATTIQLKKTKKTKQFIPGSTSRHFNSSW